MINTASAKEVKKPAYFPAITSRSAGESTVRRKTTPVPPMMNRTPLCVHDIFVSNRTKRLSITHPRKKPIPAPALERQPALSMGRKHSAHPATATSRSRFAPSSAQRKTFSRRKIRTAPTSNAARTSWGVCTPR